MNANASYKRVTSTWFSELSLCLFFLKNHQFEIIFMPKKLILGWCTLLPFTVSFPEKHTSLLDCLSLPSVHKLAFPHLVSCCRMSSLCCFIPLKIPVGVKIKLNRSSAGELCKFPSWGGLCKWIKEEYGRTKMQELRAQVTISPSSTSQEFTMEK